MLQQSGQEQLVIKLEQEVASLSTQKVELEVLLKQTFEENQYLKCCTANLSVSEEVRKVLRLRIVVCIVSGNHSNAYVFSAS